MSQIFVICGPPGAGKTSYVNEHKQWGELIIDIDNIYQALSGLPIYEKPQNLLHSVLAARKAAIKVAHDEGIRMWIVTSGATMAERRNAALGYPAEFVILRPGLDQCLARIMQDERRKDKWKLWESIVRRWFNHFQPEV